MEIVRKVVNGTDLKDIIEIPQNLINKKVEILVFPVDTISKEKKARKSLAGFLSKYAKPELALREENAWYEEAKE